jgi:hypothetical protein
MRLLTTFSYSEKYENRATVQLSAHASEDERMLHGDPDAHLGPAFLRNTDPVGTVKFASGFGGVSACTRSTAAARHTSTAGVLKRCIARVEQEGGKQPLNSDQ